MPLKTKATPNNEEPVEESPKVEEPLNEEVEAENEDEDEEEEEDESDSDVEFLLAPTSGRSAPAAPATAPATALAAPVTAENSVTAATSADSATPAKGTLDIDAEGTYNDQPISQVPITQFEDKPWRQPGADLSDFFNYGFDEMSWMAYCNRQDKLRAQGTMMMPPMVMPPMGIPGMPGMPPMPPFMMPPMMPNQR